MVETFDIIVIGSGIGGLTAASILARLKGKRVLVLEKHYVAGGLTHEFHREQYSWDTGIHYIGNIAPGSDPRLLMDLVTAKQVTWNSMPDVFDRLVFPDFTVDVHKDPQKFIENLIALFPTEEKAIRQYINDLRSANNWYIANFLSKTEDILVWLPFAIKSFGKGKLARMTTREYMDKSFKDKKLKAVLIAQWGDYGLPPERSSFGIHALVVWGYSVKAGAFFPEGGGRVIAQAVENVIEQEGGRIQVDTEVTEILVNEGSAYGVKVSQSNGCEEEFHANTIISNVGAELTFRDLVPAEYCKNEREELAGFERGTSCLTLYLGLSESPEIFGIKGENYWLYETYEMNGISDCASEIFEGNAQYGFLSFPSMKNKQAHAHTAEVCIFIDPKFFEDWAHRPNEYYEAKDKITKAMLAMLERQFPGFSEIIDYVELSTPVTLERFTSRVRGEPYGIPATPARFNLKSLKPRTSLKNLFLSGSDVCSLGIVGALHGGAAAAACIIGPMGYMRIMIGANIADKKPRPEFKATGISSHLISGFLKSKVQKTKTVFELQIKIDQEINFQAGQHIDLQISESKKRSYSVMSVNNNILTLLIDIKPGGPGSKYVMALAVGETLTFSKPKGNFQLNNNNVPICLISTGTGMVPLTAILKEYQKTALCDTAPIFLFGATKTASNFMPEYLKDIPGKIDVTYCLSREKKVKTGELRGRITDLLETKSENAFNFTDTDFYICGNPRMVQDVQRLLREKGAHKVFTELY